MKAKTRCILFEGIALAVSIPVILALAFPLGLLVSAGYSDCGGDTLQGQAVGLVQKSSV